MEQQKTGYSGSLKDARRVPACVAVARESLSLIKALVELALLSTDFPLLGPVTIGCDSKAALSLCKDRKERQRVSTSISYTTLRGIMWQSGC
jgi:hypothetical protein